MSFVSGTAKVVQLQWEALCEVQNHTWLVFKQEALDLSLQC